MIKRLALSALLTGWVAFASAQSKPERLVVLEMNGVQITSFDLEAELSKAPPDVRNSLLFRKEGVAQLASNLLVRRVLAQEYEKSGVTTDPTTQAALQLAKDRTLSDLQLIRLDDLNQPSPAAIERRALDIYRAEAKRFDVPEEVEVSHILILAATDDAEDKARKVLENLKAGASFTELATKHSQDPGSAAKGGELGYFARGRMVKEFEDAAFAMKVGQISDVIKTQFGYHILKITGRKEAARKPFEEVKHSLTSEAIQKMRAEVRTQIIERITSSTKGYPDNLDAFVASQGKR